MEKDLAIEIKGVKKCFQIGANKEETLRGSFKGLFGGSKKEAKEEFWALKSVDFEVEKGDVVGIVGKNGAGKSTLLKILSRITAPTEGEIGINGRVASLLEVGTGFHPELTGRENIFLNGTILGMSRKEVKEKFDEIVSFSGIEKFIDTPVKRYSSGMYVRLAFAVAAHLEPEILIIDEVLAVGDAEFQKKCLGKMKTVSNSGRTVLFVSHNIAAVRSLCNKGVLLRNGESTYFDNIEDCISAYMSSGSLATKLSWEKEERPGNEIIKINEVSVLPTSGNIEDEITVSTDFNLSLSFDCLADSKNIDLTFELVNHEDVIILHNGIDIYENESSKNSTIQAKVKIPGGVLNSGQYSINLIFGENHKYLLFKAADIIAFEVLNEVKQGNLEKLPGVLKMDLDWGLKCDN